MRIAFAYTELRTRVVEALSEFPYELVARNVSSSDEAYWRFVRDEWERGGAFMVVEHDIVIRPDVWRSFAACEEPWCVYPYLMRFGEVAPALGCARFSSALVSGEPDLLEVVGHISEPGYRLQDHSRPRTWRRLDTRIRQVLEERGYRWCVHAPRVEHLIAGDPAEAVVL